MIFFYFFVFGGLVLMFGEVNFRVLENKVRKILVFFLEYKFSGFFIFF